MLSTDHADESTARPSDRLVRTADIESSAPKTPGRACSTALAEKVRSKFPTDARRLPDEGLAGRVIYVGKAKNLRARAGSYFLKAAGRRSADRPSGRRRSTTSISSRPRARSTRC